MCAPSAPPAPDYQAAAKAQGVANVEAARAGAKLSNPNIITPQGTRTVTYGGGRTFDQAGYDAALKAYQTPVAAGAQAPQWSTSNAENGVVSFMPPAAAASNRVAPNRDDFWRNTGDPDVPTITETYSPGQQQIFENQQTLQQKLGALGIGAADLASGTLSNKLDFNAALGDQTQGRQAVIDSMMSRYDTDLGRRTENIESTLIARGIPRGSEAWNREMELLGRGRNDALQQATLAADNKAMDERRQKITEMLAERQVPLNEISAFRTGSQINPLQFQNYTGQNVAAAPLFAATQAQGTFDQQNYQNQVSANNGLLSGAAMLGAGAMGGTKPWWMS